MANIVITAARRTAVGSFMGSFGSTPAHLLGKAAIEAALAELIATAPQPPSPRPARAWGRLLESIEPLPSRTPP